MDSKKLQVWVPLFLALSMTAGIFIGYKMRDAFPQRSFFYMEKQRPIQEILDLVKGKYVDEVNINALADTAIEAILSKLDPHQTFIPASKLQEANEDIQGSFFGIGIEFDLLDDTLHVVSVLKDGPGFKAGLKTGDRFLKANGLPIAGKKLTEDSIRRVLRGDRGTKLDVLLLRANKQLTVAITRDMIPLVSVDAAYMLDRETGLIRLNKFSTQTYREFMEALESLKKTGLKKLILDLRGNGGGVLEEAVEIADEFIAGDKLITYTEGKNTPRKDFRCRREGQFEKGPLVVLCDEGSASASEILLGALQDWDRATIIGRTSFGKGLVQEQFQLVDNSALRLTVARYYTPVGRSIQRSYANGQKAYYHEITDRILNGKTKDSVQLDSILSYKSAAGKKLYGGGGIQPDIYVDADTSQLSIVLGRIYSKGLINQFAYRYILENDAVDKTYKSATEFANGFSLTDNDWRSFEQLLLKDSIPADSIKVKDKEFISRSIKASIARQIWRNDGYFEVYNKSDEAVLKAIDLLK